jgi:hypothetical protein
MYTVYTNDGEQVTYPRIVYAIPDDGMYLVALTEEWGRILDLRRRCYWAPGLIGTHLAMTGPWEDYAGPQEVLPAWVAQAQDELGDLTPEQRHALALRWERWTLQQRRLAVETSAPSSDREPA